MRCTKGGYKCEGYKDPPKAWIFEYSRDKSPKEEASSSDQDDSSSTALTIPSREPTDSPSEEFLDVDPNKSVRTLIKFLSEQQAGFLLQPTSPYKTADEQRAIKHFFEVTGPMLCRYSDPEVWMAAIPQSKTTLIQC